MEWLSLIVSAVLAIAVSGGGWLIGRVVNRIDRIEETVGSMGTRDTQQDGRIEALEGKPALTREDLRDVLEKQLAKATAPITRELEAIRTSSTDTRERLVKLEATFEASSRRCD